VVEEAAGTQPNDAVLISDDEPAPEAGDEDDDLEADPDDDYDDDDDDTAELTVPEDPLRYMIS
jgi:hypothetical protein